MPDCRFKTVAALAREGLPLGTHPVEAGLMDRLPSLG